MKPLVWEDQSRSYSYPDRFEAKMPCQSGDYSVVGSKKRHQFQWFRNGHFVRGHERHEPMPLDAAKAAAQADYERRILSAIETDGEAE